MQRRKGHDELRVPEWLKLLLFPDQGFVREALIGMLENGWIDVNDETSEDLESLATSSKSSEGQENMFREVKECM